MESIIAKIIDEMTEKTEILLMNQRNQQGKHLNSKQITISLYI